MKLLLLSALALLLQLASAAAESPAEKQIFDELNHERQNTGLPALEWNKLAADAARKHARLLADHGELSHQLWLRKF